jgi:hypothetical protein
MISSFICYSYITSSLLTSQLPVSLTCNRNVVTSYLQVNVSERVRPIPVPKVVVQRPVYEHKK